MFERLLETVPFSARRPGFQSLVLRAVDSLQPPLMDMDLRLHPVTASELVELARVQMHEDTAIETQAYWDLWIFDLRTGRWELSPQPIQIVCAGDFFDDAACEQTGHFQAEVGFEHLFTGHAGLLTGASSAAAVSADPAEAAFFSHMADPAHLAEYGQHTRENIRALLGWVQRLEQVEGVERCRLWSEGEENVEAKLDEILARH